MQYKAVIFDLDGTLVHTTSEYRYQVVGRALKDLGAKASNHHIDRFWFEARRDEIIEKYFELEPKLFWKTYYSYDTIEIRKNFTKLYDDTDIISELKQNGYKLGIVTGAPKHIANLEIDMLGQKNFDSIIIAQPSNGIMPKPHPQGLEKCLCQLDVDKNEAIYVGNADKDVATAKNAQVLDVLLVRGEHDFPNINPSLKIHSLYELRQLLKI